MTDSAQSGRNFARLPEQKKFMNGLFPKQKITRFRFFLFLYVFDDKLIICKTGTKK